MTTAVGSLDLDEIAAAARRCPLVVELSGGRFGEVASYLPGHRVVGVRVVDGEVEVHVVAAWGPPLAQVADAVREIVGPLTGGMPAAVFIDDIAVPDELAGRVDGAP